MTRFHTSVTTTRFPTGAASLASIFLVQLIFLLLAVTEVMEAMKDQHVKVTEVMETSREVVALNWMLLLGTIPWFYLALASSSCKQQSHKIGHMRIKNLMH
jgi:hypothetical protein